MKGSHLLDPDLFAALDLKTRGLERVRTAVDAGDWASARKVLADYLRNRAGVPWTISPHVADRSSVRVDRQAAEDAAAGKIRVVTIWHTFPQGDLDWFYNETFATPGLPHNNEWQWQLNRMEWWSALEQAYRATGEERYAQAFVKQLRSWIAQCPPPAQVRNTPGSAWRTIECGIRMSSSWPNAFYTFLLSLSFTDDDIVDYLKVCVEHARYLRAHSTTGNWLTMEMAGLYTVGALFPELQEAREWRSYAADRLYKELSTQFLPDGAQVELTPGYHNVALDNVLKIPGVARIVGRMDELPSDYITRTERAFDFDLYLMTPDRSLPRLNDSWPYNVAGRMVTASDLFPNRPDFAWVASGGKKGSPPTLASYPFPYAGYFVMRSGWETNANYLCLDAGPLGYGHVHQDKLNVVLWAYGREILFDSGGGSYEQSRWRAYATDTYSHNTVLVDNKPQRRQTRDREANISRTPVDAGWQSTRQFDFARGIYDEGYGSEQDHPATHTRRVLFLKPDPATGSRQPVFLVADTLTPRDAAGHSNQARWHLLTTSTDRDETTGTVTTTDPGKPNLAVVPLLHDGLEVRSASAQTEPELLGWNIRKDMDPQYVPATTVLHTRRGAGTQRFLTLLLPIPPGASNPVRQVSPINPATVEVLLNDGSHLHITDNPDGTLAITETIPDGKPGRHVTVGSKG